MSVPEEEGLRYMIGKLEGKIDALIASMQRQTTDIHEHEQRIRILEIIQMKLSLKFFNFVNSR